MAKTYYLDATVSDFSLGGQSTNELAVALGSLATHSIIAASGGGTQFIIYVEPSDTSITRISLGAFGVEVNIVSAVNDTQMRMRLHRINSSGSIQASTGFTGYQATTSTGLLNFSDSSNSLGTWLTTDRLGVELEVQNNAAHGGVKGPTHDLETINAEVTTPFSEVSFNPITAVLPGEFDVVSSLTGSGKLDAALAIEYEVVASLVADGKLDAALAAEYNLTAVIASGILAVVPIEYNIAADLKADGLLSVGLPIEFNISSFLGGQGKLDSLLPMEYSILANLTFGLGGISASLPIEYNVIASLAGDGQLISAPSLVFNLAGNLLSASVGSISATLSTAFSIAGPLVNANIPIYPFIDRRHIAAFIK